MSALVRVLTIVAFVGASSVAAAQGAGRLRGVVRDAAGAPLPSAVVTASRVTGPNPFTVRTNELGEFTIEQLPPDRYNVTAEFGSAASRNYEIAINDQDVTLDLMLNIASAIEHVTVTATKSGQTDIQTTPIAVTSITSTLLDRMGAQNVVGLADMVPTLTVSPSTFNTLISIRGIGTNSNAAGSDPSSTMHVDGVYLARPMMAFMDFLDVDRVEVLRGPQGTLYGRNSVGGTINVVSRMPTNTLEVRGRVAAGDYDTFRVETAVSGPLIRDKVMAGVAIRRVSHTGFVSDLNHPDHSLGGDDTWAGRGQIRIVPGSRAEILVAGDASNNESNPLFYVKPLAAKPGFPPFDNPDGLWNVRASHLASGHSKQQGALARVTLQPSSGLTVKSLTGARWSDYHAYFDPDGTELSLLTTDVADKQHQISEEITLLHRTEKQSLVGGFFYFDEKDDGPVEITQFNPPPGVQRRPNSTIDGRSWALFGEGTWQLSRRVSVVGGLRYSDEHKDAHNVGGLYLRGTNIVADASTYYNFNDHVDSSAWTPKVALQFEAQRNAFLYASATRGFKSGGINVTATTPGLGFKPEFAWSFEGGFKRRSGDGRFHVNTAAFFTDYRDLQVQTFVAAGIIDVSNAATATIQGVEIETGAVLGRLQLSGTFAWLDATYDQYLAAAAGGPAVDAAGHRLNNAPEWSGSASVEYTFDVGRWGRTSIRGDVPWQSQVFFTAFNTPIESQNAYGRLHARVGFQPRRSPWEVSFYVRNANNQEYVTGTSTAPPVPAFNGRPGEPRQWGVQLAFRY